MRNAMLFSHFKKQLTPSSSLRSNPYPQRVYSNQKGTPLISQTMSSDKSCVMFFLFLYNCDAV